MGDPYKVLGISRNASDDEVKKAYREMCRKYHPDRNPGNEAAEEMFKIVQEAYSQIMEERKNGGSTASNGYGYGYGYNYNSGYGQNTGSSQTYSGPAENAAKYQAASNYINNGYYKEAITVLLNVADRDAMWYYLSALANAGMGNNYMSVQQARTAVEMEPGNAVYRELLSRLSSGGASYFNRQQGMYGGGMTDGDYCTRLCALNICLNLCCDASCCC